MSDYISREEALMAVTRAKLPDTTPDGVPIANGKRSVTDCVRRIKAIPAADVRPVKRGTWDDKSVAFYFKCSECGCCVRAFAGEVFLNYMQSWNYCPNCGADMMESKQESKQVGILEGES